MNDEIQRLVSRIEKAQSVDAVSQILAEAILTVGMTASASGMVSGPRALGPSRFHFVNWPDDWLTLYEKRGYVSIDAIPRWAVLSGEACSWAEVIQALPPGDPSMEVYRAAQLHGFHVGFVTPVRSRSGALGLVSVGGGQREPLQRSERLLLQVLSSTALLRAEFLLGSPDPTPSSYTLRERECLALLGQGFSDREISRVLDIAPTTVRFHLSNARVKAGARNRVDLAVRSPMFTL